jgi:DNA-binding winged helix-turn-helix (wHTH) protein
MQVLVALARADGRIVTRDELIDWCWNGRIVGEDAINRAIFRLRQVAGGIGGGGFRIETITKVGYRLVARSTSNVARKSIPAPAVRANVSRRTMIARRLLLRERPQPACSGRSHGNIGPIPRRSSSSGGAIWRSVRADPIKRGRP